MIRNPYGHIWRAIVTRPQWYTHTDMEPGSRYAARNPEEIDAPLTRACGG
jgi:hypothetical protein